METLPAATRLRNENAQEEDCEAVPPRSQQSSEGQEKVDMVQPAIESNRTSPTLDLGNACLAQFRCNLDEIRRGVAMTSESDVYRIIESADVAPAGNVLGMHMFKKGSLQISNVILVSRDVAKKLAAGHLKQRYAGKM